MRFQHRTGERPLPGYTIKRGVGQGGFGEVYFAVSDAGKEVALKLLRGASDIELRGVANCLNLKHPNLIHIYDLKVDDRGGQWLVMEYVLGESLAQVLDRHPNGLPPEVAVEWFRGLARAVNYLHDHGVVHRDLKPANIFIEHGNLKVGDYGLCKAMSTSGRPQTRAVGTVHYMAPEISNGMYSKSIDVYACGVILYEMLTGRPPFEGETDAEVLMKHLTAEPDLERLPPHFRAVIAKALDKSPQRRFETLSEMLRAVEGCLAGRAVEPPAVKQSPLTVQIVDRPAAAEPRLSTAMPMARTPLVQPVEPVESLPTRVRLMDWSGAMTKAPLMVALGVLLWKFLTGTMNDWTGIGKGWLLTLALTWAALLAVGNARRKSADTWILRGRAAFLGLLIGVFAFWLEGWPMPEFLHEESESAQTESYLFDLVRMSPAALPIFGSYMLYFAAAMGLIRWWKFTARDRKERFSLFPIICAGLWGFVLSLFWPRHVSNAQFGVIPLMIAAAVVQWVSPWSPPPPPLPKRLRWKR